MKKQSYLVNQYLKNYLLASLATIAVLNINSMIDGILMGRFLGPDALAAINLSLPLLNVIETFALLIGGGSSVVAAQALSKGDSKNANHSFATALITMAFIGIIIFVLAPFIASSISNVLCVTPELLEKTKEYVLAILYGSIFIMVNSVLMLLVEVGGSPQTATKCSLVNCIINVLLDIVLVGIFGLGIAGAAIALVISTVFSIVFSGTFYLNKKCPFRFSLKNINFFSSLKDNVLNGIPNAVASISLTIVIAFCSHYVQLADGADGMFVMSIGIITISLSFILTTGSSSTFVAIGSLLQGRGDNKGLYMLFQRCMFIVMLGPIVITVLDVFFPRQVALMFGADAEHTFELAAANLPLISCYIWSVSVNIFLATVYQIGGKLIISIVTMASSEIVLCLMQVIISRLISVEYVWHSFWITSVISLLITAIMAETVRRKSKEKIRIISLLPLDINKGCCLNVSVPCTTSGVLNELEEVRGFCEKAGLGDLSNKIVHCIEELSINIVEHSGRKENEFIDIYINIEDHEVKAFLQDNGVAFDPVSIEECKQSSGLKILHSYCSDLSYDYLFGQNVTHMKWRI